MITLLVLLTAIITIGLIFFRPDRSTRLVNFEVFKAASVDVDIFEAMIVALKTCPLFSVPL